MPGKLTILGIMSGTSCDGLDFALCDFNYYNEKYNFDIIHTEFIAYNNYWIKKLKTASRLSGYDLINLHREYGFYIGETAKNILEKHSFNPHYISSHGHTIFHEPKNKFNFQLGDGAAIVAKSGIPVICDFRSTDIALGGQGAPLVPVGDKLLFNEYNACLNLGGFSNISFSNNENIIAFDICPVNFILNPVAQRKGISFDDNGTLGKQGKLIESLLNQLNNIEYYALEAPKTLSEEWVIKEINPILDKYAQNTVEDILATLYQHIAMQISSIFNIHNFNKVLVTGGGTHNGHLISLIRKYSKPEIIIPDNRIIDFKEAIIFGFLGYLYLQNQHNCLSNVTGAKQDHIGGTLYKI